MVAQGVCVLALGGGVHGCTGGACMVAPGGGEIRSMSGRYASYWNAFLFSNVPMAMGPFCLLFIDTMLNNNGGGGNNGHVTYRHSFTDEKEI